MESNTTESFPNVSDVGEYLEGLSAQSAKRNLPVILYLAFLMIIGIFGNSLVLYVYSYRFKRSSSVYFIISLGIFDLLACVIAIPVEIYDIQHKYTFYSPIACTLVRYCGSFVQYSSVYLLVGVAIDRYIKICYPLKMISPKKIKWMCVGAAIAGVISSSPTFLLYGIKKEKTPHPDIHGGNCSIAQKYSRTLFEMIYFLLMSATFVACVLLMIILYSLIWCTVKRRRGSVIGDSVRKTSETDSTKRMYYKKQTSVNSDDDNNSVFLPNNHSKSSSKRLRRRMSSVSAVLKKIKVTRTTVLLFAVTLAFILSYFPSVVAMVYLKKIPKYELLYTFFVKFSFMNNAINPIIYSFLNVNFRTECKELLKRCYCGKIKPPSRQTSMETEEDVK
ncbi:neuromedin-U receptor 1-like isoform X3 [Octopus vulgaris]|uniref:Neuromedin-U receptor 1-like isoform X3 n=2 Tax=Octopus TaxID=6643 RepID=A0AA36AI32_OCTVU|nr:C5a anaphylatoxin chemotactic receptor 1 [Octopus sinensis]CAI9715918.1 neuromedin-U receptor 1-like isoform X3 [Octopus vulgaris]